MSGSKISFISLGCEKNRINTEIMMKTLRDAGYEITAHIEGSDVCVINTCGFIDDAKKEAIETFFEVLQLKKEKKLKKIIVCGCLVQRYAGEIEKELYEADGYVGVGSFGRIAEAVELALRGEKPRLLDDRSLLPIEGERILTSPPYSVNIKIAEGCDNRCGYCAIPQIRGGYRSRKMESVVAEAEHFIKRGAKEIVLIAQDTTSYGIDLYGKRVLPELIKKICQIEGDFWLRAMYLYPDKITDELIDVIKTEPKAVKYIEMAIQHASGDVLRKMNRPGDDKSLLLLVNKLRHKIPGVTLRTTVMVGYPGETERDFEILCEFLKKARFERLGVFEFSPQEKTPAYDMAGQVADDIKAARAEAVLTLQGEITKAQQEALIGRTLTVLCEGYDRYAECFYGRSGAEAPDIDGRIFFRSDKPVNSGDFVRVTLTERVDFELIGEICCEHAQ